MLKALMLASAFVLVTTSLPAKADSQENDLYRFDVECSFPDHPSCAAFGRIFKRIDSDLQASDSRWGGNLLAVVCDGELISASDASLVRREEHPNIRWELWNAAQTLEIDLGDHPFRRTTTVTNAVLEFRHRRINGRCEFRPTDVHGVQNSSSLE